MRRSFTFAMVLGILGGLACPVFADQGAAPPRVPPRGTECPDVKAKPSLPTTYEPTPRGAEGPEMR